MCGVFGFVDWIDGRPPGSYFGPIVTELGRAAEHRGKDSSGLVLQHVGHDGVSVFKGNLRIGELLGSAEVSKAFRQFIARAAAVRRGTVLAMGHSRLVTNGSQLHDDNNQPVLKDGIIGLHNGIITNDAAIWARHPDLSRQYEIDTEVMLALIGSGLRRGRSIAEAVGTASREVVGTYSMALLFPDRARLALASNHGSLYFLTNARDCLAFASEESTLDNVRAILPTEVQGELQVTQVAPHDCVVVSLDRFQLEVHRNGGAPSRHAAPGKAFAEADSAVEIAPVEIRRYVVAGRRPRQELVLDTEVLARAPEARSESRLLEYWTDRIRQLRRCSRCILPETFPFIAFDADGVCNYCHGYAPKNQPKPLTELAALIEPYRSPDGRADCIVPYSGGRDSTYALHVIKTELHLNPIAFTYDWGMVTDLARRNIARVCGKLAVEHIIVAADIYRKRDNIRRNILAWLRKPHLGMIPLFMAGDKYFYYYASKVAKQTGIRLNIWGINPLENTDFKVGFLGVPPDFQKKRIYSLSVSRQFRLFGNVARAVLTNPAYANRSLLDSIGSFFSRSIMPHHDYFHLYDYVRWDETEIEKVMFDVYDWERACDTDTTWRIGDGTAAFYNYIYCTVAGFSEHDTFRSNQIREGELSREAALALVERDNRPRYPTIKWYLAIVGLEFDPVIKRINAIPKLY
jgi:hypothetical protein